MLSINTNLSGLIAQSSMKTSTDKLNQAIERMSTGFKINHASDNAANYSISTNMTTKLNAYDVAADNIADGMDLVTTAMDTISMMQDKAARLSALSTQARNGTYGSQSLSAINTEAQAIMSEIMRLYNTSQYNGVDLFNRTAYTIASHLPQAGVSGFIDETALVSATSAEENEYGDFIANPKTYTDAEVAAMTRVADVSTFTSGQKYSISSVEELQKLADYVNAGNATSSVEFVLAEDIDLSSISNWTPIGDKSGNPFRGTFDGNSHVIKNLTIDNESTDYQGLFGYGLYDCEIKNVGLENSVIKGNNYTGSIVGRSHASIINCYSTGSVEGNNYTGGIAGTSSGITNSYSTADVKGADYTGGLFGYSYSVINNSYATGDVIGNNYTGGLSGSSYSITNCYATGDVSGNENVGGLTGYITSTISNSYATGNVNATKNVGGLVGHSFSSSISNTYTTGSVSGESFVGGLVGNVEQKTNTTTISNSVSYSTVSGNDSNSTGSLVGGAVLTADGNLFGTFTTTACESISQEGMNSLGSVYKSDSTIVSSYDASAIWAGISDVAFHNISTNLQVGINGDSSCQLEFDTNFQFNLSGLNRGIESDEAFEAINEFVKVLSDKSTALGAVQNRLESALESVEVNINNLTSSRSTIRDADIAEVSSHYIQQQILQQASATLLATANQSPSIALQLI